VRSFAKELILAAIDCRQSQEQDWRDGYSTCSVAVAENELLTSPFSKQEHQNY
jgi:hypothetical protein